MNKLRWLWAALASLALALTVAGVPAFFGAAAGADEAACAPSAKAAKLNLTIKDMNGKEVNLAAYKGKVILLDFWATWCGPCKIEIPAFVELQDRYRDQGLVVLGFSVDDPIDKLKPFAQQFKMNYPVLVGRDREDVQDAYGPIWGIPTTFLIGRNGKICKKHMGLATKEQFEKEIKALLGLTS